MPIFDERFLSNNNSIKTGLTTNKHVISQVVENGTKINEDFNNAQSLSFQSEKNLLPELEEKVLDKQGTMAHRNKKNRAVSSIPTDDGVEVAGASSDTAKILKNMEQMTQIMLSLTQNVNALSSVPVTPTNVAGPSRPTGFNMLVPKYDPSDELSSITAYIQKIEQLASINGWDDQTIIFVTMSNLKGMALKWFNSKKKNGSYLGGVESSSH
ncbi:hypothetical protein RN001_008865 [Aquatica leii]|uniref:Uncharacterized protein n=1 Tax=Aquatica leii TaxID=1421715 RepID=A0AAN7PAV8_9COLE|nr:hypothetical protein RN001_008865 [Aquatica leii]